MQVTIKGMNLDVTPALKQHAYEKVKKLEHRGLEIREVEVRLFVEKNPSIHENQVVELTLWGDCPVIRAKEEDEDMYVAVDKALGKLERQITKYHDKRIGRTQHHESALRSSKQGVGVGTAEIRMEGPVEIARRKKVDMKPMTSEEAALQMELLGHDFYLFTDAETDQPNVIYMRRDGTLGIIEPSS